MSDRPKNPMSDHQRERMARRLAAVWAAEMSGSASVDRLFKKYQGVKIGGFWLKIADLFWEIGKENMKGSEVKPAHMRKVVQFRKPE